MYSLFYLRILYFIRFRGNNHKYIINMCAHLIFFVAIIYHCGAVYSIEKYVYMQILCTLCTFDRAVNMFASVCLIIYCWVHLTMPTIIV